jgi:hypothetical protein
MYSERDELILKLERLTVRGIRLRKEYEAVLQEFLTVQQQIRILRHSTPSSLDRPSPVLMHVNWREE